SGSRINECSRLLPPTESKQIPVLCYSAMARCSIFGILLFVAVVAPILACDTKHSFPRPTGYVDDFAKVIDSNTKDRLTAICIELDQKTHAQIAVVNVQTLEKSSIEDLP